ncbi:uncharacterized protein LOC124438294 [Xenia sp. Carnegie-2017]|uniref:uncharacterized protein LOC124438294 n=1 Tax=Xenia sp. Carnegie-2017 TaxID=2897299 RepID=UPI001F04FC9F|nr:uncharacterized protein LOC124438294 [Xenia sp. Carnegie-2017]
MDILYKIFSFLKFGWRSGSVKHHLEEGNRCMNNGDYEQAIEHYTQCLRHPSKNSVKMMAHFGAGNACVLSDKWEDGLNCFDECLKTSSKVKREFFQHQVYLGLGNTDSTTERIVDDLKKNKMVSLCHIVLGGLNKKLGNYEKSLEHYRKGFFLIDCQHQENQQELEKEPKKVDGINVSKDFIDHNMKNLSVITSTEIMNGVLVVYRELAELFEKLNRWDEATCIYKIYLEVATEDDDVQEQRNAMVCLIRIYRKDERDNLRESVQLKLQELDNKKNNAVSELQWKFVDESTKHNQLFLKMIKCGQDPKVKVECISDVRVIFSGEFCIGKGSDGTRVYLGLGKDGHGKAVKRMPSDICIGLTQQGKKTFEEIIEKKSNYVVNYFYLEEDITSEYVYLILDLCEESLEDFVQSESNSLAHLQKSLPKILRQILKGLAHLHSEPHPIFHRDLKPSNVLRDVQGKFLIADFGISRILKSDYKTFKHGLTWGSDYWASPESYCPDDESIKKSHYEKESDVMSAGIVAFYVATKGKHPFGDRTTRLQNLSNGNPVELKNIVDVELKDLLSWMLQLKPELRPSANEALKHPYLQSDECKFDLMCDAGSQPEIKIPYLGHPVNSDVREQLNGLKNWKDRIDPEVFSNFNVGHYDATWLGCLKFIQNVHQHWNDVPRPKRLQSDGNYKTFFLQVFPELPLLVNRVIRLNEWKYRPDLKEHFSISELQLQEWKYIGESTKHKELLLKLTEYGQDLNNEVKHLNDIRVVFSEEFLLGKGSDGTRVYLGLGKDGYGKAVKRINRDNCIRLAQQKKKIEAKRSNCVVNYSYLEDITSEYVYLILDLCEESLEDFVQSESNSLAYLQKSLPKILRQILKGLAHLHSDPHPILHRDLKPSNVFRDAQGKFLIADFGMSQILKIESNTLKSGTKMGAGYWIAPELYCEGEDSFDKARYKKESDVMNAGMVAFYVATRGKHPYGTQATIVHNLLHGIPVLLNEIDDVKLKDLLSWMLQYEPKLRPSATEALEHPYLQSDEKNFDMLCEMANQPGIEIPYLGHPLNSDVREQLNGLNNWVDRIEPKVFSNFNKSQYDSTWLGCLKFLQNVHENWHDELRLQLSLYVKDGNYQEYFLEVFSELPLLVNKIKRLIKWKSRPDLKEHFSKWKYIGKSTKHEAMISKLIEYEGKIPNVQVEDVNGVRVIFSDEFIIGCGSNGTRVYLGLGKDGYGKAVKRILRIECINLAHKETEILNELSAKESKFVVNYHSLKEDTGTDSVYLILDLCEESLEDFVQSESNSLAYLQKSLPEILRHILKGLSDLHSGKNPILHRDLKPSNVLRDAQGKFLIADFGISRILKDGSKTRLSNAKKGTPHWIAPESFCTDKNKDGKGRYKTESDVMTAGMVAFYVATKGDYPFKIEEDILKGNPVGLEKIDDFDLKDLLTWMLQLKPEDRPSANEALKHPYLQTDEENFDLLCDVGNQPEIKTSSRHPLTSDVCEQLNITIDWMNRIYPEVFKHFNKVSYDSTWLGCLRFLRNVRQHWYDKPRPQLSSYVKDGNYQKYFLQLFMELPLLVHRTIRLSDWKTRPVLEKHFANSAHPVKREEGKGKKSEAVIEYPDLKV